MDLKSYNSTSIAYVGDAVWSLKVREFLLLQGYQRAGDLQRLSTYFVSAKSQRIIYEKLEQQNFFTEEENYYFKRGRNAKSKTVPKNTDVITYHYSTGFETLIGYLYFTNQVERINEIFEKTKGMVKL